MVTEAPAGNLPQQSETVAPLILTDLTGERIPTGEPLVPKDTMFEGQAAKIEFATKTGMMCAECVGCATCPLFQKTKGDLLVISEVDSETTKPKPTAETAARAKAPFIPAYPMEQILATPPAEMARKKDHVGWSDDMRPPTVADLIPEVKPVLHPVIQEQLHEEPTETKPIESVTFIQESPPVEIQETAKQAPIESSQEEPIVDSSIVRTTEPFTEEIEEVVEASVQTEPQESEGETLKAELHKTDEINQQLPMDNQLEQVKPKDQPTILEDMTATVVLPKQEEWAPVEEEPITLQLETPKALLDEIVRIAQGPPVEFTPKDTPAPEADDEKKTEDDVIILRSSDRLVKVERKKLLRILPALHLNLRRSVEYKRLVEALEKKTEEQPIVVDTSAHVEFAPEELLWQNTVTQQVPVNFLFYLWLFLREEVLESVHEESKPSHNDKRYPKLDNHAVLWVS